MHWSDNYFPSSDLVYHVLVKCLNANISGWTLRHIESSRALILFGGIKVTRESSAFLFVPRLSSDFESVDSAIAILLLPESKNPNIYCLEEFGVLTVTCKEGNAEYGVECKVGEPPHTVQYPWLQLLRVLSRNESRAYQIQIKRDLTSHYILAYPIEALFEKTGRTWELGNGGNVSLLEGILSTLKSAVPLLGLNFRELVSLGTLCAYSLPSTYRLLVTSTRGGQRHRGTEVLLLLLLTST